MILSGRVDYRKGWRIRWLGQATTWTWHCNIYRT